MGGAKGFALGKGLFVILFGQDTLVKRSGYAVWTTV